MDFVLAASTPSESTATHTVDLTLTGSGGTLEAPLTATIGFSAVPPALTPGVDFTFAQMTVTFPAGSGPGAVQPYTIGIVDDRHPHECDHGNAKCCGNKSTGERHRRKPARRPRFFP